MTLAIKEDVKNKENTDILEIGKHIEIRKHVSSFDVQEYA